MTTAHRIDRVIPSGLAGLALTVFLLAGCTDAGGTTEPDDTGTCVQRNVEAQVALYTAMHGLWSDHMQWTWSTVDAFFHNPDALQASLDRLLQNQSDIGAAIVPYYGQDAGDELTALLTIHIEQAVPVLEAAQAGDDVALDTALTDWYANAKDIAGFLSSANPSNWPTSATEPMMEDHITQTTTYAVDLLGGDYAQAVVDYDMANHHMMMLADTLAAGIIAQYPEQFED